MPGRACFPISQANVYPSGELSWLGSRGQGLKRVTRQLNYILIQKDINLPN